jgi:hypothetical protein
VGLFPKVDFQPPETVSEELTTFIVSTPDLVMSSSVSDSDQVNVFVDCQFPGTLVKLSVSVPP